MTGRCGEVAEVMKKGKADIMCVQEMVMVERGRLQTEQIVKSVSDMKRVSDW